MTDIHPGHWLVDTKMIAEVEAAIAAGDAQRASELRSDPTVLMTAVEIPVGAEVWERVRAEAAVGGHTAPGVEPRSDTGTRATGCGEVKNQNRARHATPVARRLISLDQSDDPP